MRLQIKNMKDKEDLNPMVFGARPYSNMDFDSGHLGGDVGILEEMTKVPPSIL